MSNPDTRTFMIKGDPSVFGKSKGRASRKKKEGGFEDAAYPQISRDAPLKVQKAGGCNPQGPTLIMNGTPVATAGVVPLGVQSVVRGFQAPVNNPISGSPVSQSFVPPLQQQGGADDKKVSVELKKPIGGQRKVHLTPKKAVSSQGVLKDSHKSGKTRKVRKITLGISAMQKRVTRAKKIREKVKEMPFDDLRKELIKRGLIKESSKAPESILRQIAADSQIVGSKGL
jgi:hypothetical protein